MVEARNEWTSRGDSLWGTALYSLRGRLAEFAPRKKGLQFFKTTFGETIVLDGQRFFYWRDNRKTGECFQVEMSQPIEKTQWVWEDYAYMIWYHASLTFVGCFVLQICLYVMGLVIDFMLIVPFFETGQDFLERTDRCVLSIPPITTNWYSFYQARLFFDYPPAYYPRLLGLGVGRKSDYRRFFVTAKDKRELPTHLNCHFYPSRFPNPYMRPKFFIQLIGLVRLIFLTLYIFGVGLLFWKWLVVAFMFCELMEFYAREICYQLLSDTLTSIIPDHALVGITPA